LIPTNRSGLTDNTFNLKINADISPTKKLTLISRRTQILATTLDRVGGTSYMNSASGIAATLDRIGHTLSWRLYTNEYWARTRVDENVLSAQLTSQVSAQTYWNLQIQRTAKQYHTGPGSSRTADTTEIYPGVYLDQAPFGFESSPVFALGDGMGMGGSTSTSRDSSKYATYYARFNYTNQVSHMHQLGAGSELVYDQFNLRYGMKNLALPDGNLWTDFERNPYRLMFYVQDKIEAKGFIADLGLNADFINPNGDWYAPKEGPFDQEFFSSAFSKDQEDEIPTTKAEGSWYASPRLGISHPITVNSKLYFNYGHNRQVPTAEQVFKVRRNPLDDKMSQFGDPNMPLAKTISYEIGFDQAIGKYLLHLTAYYKDVTNQQDWARYINIKGNVNYRQLTSNSYEDIRGFELELAKNFGDWVQGSVNYEYRVNTSGHFGITDIYGTTNIYENPSEQRDYIRENPPFDSRPLPRPRFKGLLTLTTPQDFGPAIANQYLLGGWLVNFIGFWTNGSWFTWNPNKVRGLAYNLRWKPYQNVDLKAAKSIRLGQVKATLFVDVSNVFNFKNFSGESFYDVYDYNDYIYSLQLPESVTDKLTIGDRDYHGIPGSDQPGDVRDRNVDFVPMEYTGNIENYILPDDIRPGREMYVYDATTEQYFRPDYNGGWVAADMGRIKEIKDTKAYIDMPNQTYFTFLNPRDIYFGFNISLDLR
ncbi:MAG: TonB-dependent receptor, partial [Candidatus Marinimicrobia bacterium]|nr:TonB-dependent receptor [Candidatus Neomarinimicrobiota bacterium]